MKTFKFSEATTKKVVDACNKSYLINEIINDVMALSTVQKHYGSKCKIRIFKTYINNIIYAYYEDEGIILDFDSEIEAYKFIFALK